MKPSNQCFELIKHFEGCKTIAYKDAVGIWTIGYGNTFFPSGKPVKQGDVVTKQEADSMFPLILERFAISVDQMVRVDLEQHEFDALVALAYNIGIGNFEQSTLLRFVNRNFAPESVCSEFIRWNKAKGKVLAGLTRRRQAEAYLYQTGELKFNFA